MLVLLGTVKVWESKRHSHVRHGVLMRPKDVRIPGVSLHRFRAAARHSSGAIRWCSVSGSVPVHRLKAEADSPARLAAAAAATKLHGAPPNFFSLNGLPRQRCVSLHPHRYCLQSSYPADEKFGVIFTFCASALLPVRAWRDSRLYSASESSGPKKLRRKLGSGYGVPMGVGAKIVCSAE